MSYKGGPCWWCGKDISTLDIHSTEFMLHMQMDCPDKEAMAERMHEEFRTESYRLEMELVPRALWGESLAQKYKSQWNKLRKQCYANANFQCEICGGVGKNGRIEAHEIWQYTLDDNTMTGIQKLIRLIALCPNCHAFKHLGRTIRQLPNEVIRETLRHAAIVNEWTLQEYQSHRDNRMEEWNRRNQYEWTQDLTQFLN